jgi:Protein of unknown function (DUF3298)
MKQKLITILSVVFILTACDSNSTQSSASGQTTQAAIQLPNSFYKKFVGSIDDISIVMDLTKRDSVLTGQCYHTTVGIPLTLNGHISSDGKFYLSEMNDKYEETGKFDGFFLSGKSISGTWTDPKTKKTLSFNLTEKTDNVVAISFYNRHSENCKNAEKNKKQHSADAIAWDTLCTTLDLELIQVTAPSNKATQKINEAIKKIACGLGSDNTKYSSVDDLMNSVNSVEDDVGYELSISSSLVTNDQDILSVSIGESYYGFGDAHPSSRSTYHNFDIRTGKEITLDELLTQEYETTLNQIAEKKFIETNGSDGWDFEKGKFKLNRNFAITPSGLLFSYNQYEIGCYAMGAPEVFIAYNDIDNLIKPNGLLETWRKKQSSR